MNALLIYLFVLYVCLCVCVQMFLLGCEGCYVILVHSVCVYTYTYMNIYHFIVDVGIIHQTMHVTCEM